MKVESCRLSRVDAAYFGGGILKPQSDIRAIADTNPAKMAAVQLHQKRPLAGDGNL